MSKDCPYLKISIELESYHIANLLLALEYVPESGEWMSHIINKIYVELEKQGIKPEEFYYRPNSMKPRDVRRHLDVLEHREKFKDGRGK